MFAFDDLKNVLFLMSLPAFVVIEILREGMKHSAIPRVRSITARLLREDRKIFWQRMALAESAVLYAPAAYWPGTYVPRPVSAFIHEQDIAGQLGNFVGASIHNTFWPRGTAAQMDYDVAQIRLRDRQRQHAAAVRLARESEDFPVPFSPNTRETQAEGGNMQAPGSLILSGEERTIRSILSLEHPGITSCNIIFIPELQQARMLIKADSSENLLQFLRAFTAHGVKYAWRALHADQDPKQFHHNNPYDI